MTQSASAEPPSEPGHAAPGEPRTLLVSRSVLQAMARATSREQLLGREGRGQLLVFAGVLAASMVLGIGITRPGYVLVFILLGWVALAAMLWWVTPRQHATMLARSIPVGSTLALQWRDAQSLVFGSGPAPAALRAGAVAHTHERDGHLVLTLRGGAGTVAIPRSLLTNAEAAAMQAWPAEDGPTTLPPVPAPGPVYEIEVTPQVTARLRRAYVGSVLRRPVYLTLLGLVLLLAMGGVVLGVTSGSWSLLGALPCLLLLVAAPPVSIRRALRLYDGAPWRTTFADDRMYADSPRFSGSFPYAATSRITRRGDVVVVRSPALSAWPIELLPPQEWHRFPVTAHDHLRP